MPALRTALGMLRESRHDVIVASAPPFSSLLLGAALSRYTKVPLAVDYRDEWDVSNRYWENRQPGAASVAMQRMMERHVLRRAQLVIATSRQSAAALTSLCRTADSSASVTHIYNGFDPEDFTASAAAKCQRPNGSWRLVYTGTLYNLMSPEPLVKAIEALVTSAPALTGKIEMVFAGRRAPEQDRILDRLAGVCRLQRRDYLSHDEAIALMRSADALCVLLNDLPGAGRVVPAKIFEYMASCKPIIAVAPSGEMWDLLRSYPAAFICAPDEVSKLRDWLADSVCGNTSWPEIDVLTSSPYDRRRQAQDLASLLNEVSVRRSPSTSTAERLACSG
jgi:glycosyltransferase involved in cell wall biosynthesis